MTARRELAVLAAVWLGLHLPFLNQAFVIDEGHFVDQTLQIVRAPTAPYSFAIRLAKPWSAYEYLANPPGIGYFLAPVVATLGPGETGLHLACMLFSGLALLAIWLLAREVVGAGLYPALLVACFPAFLLSSHTVMPDVPAAAFATLSIFLLFRGDKARPAVLAWAGAAAGAAALFKYSALFVIGLLVLYPLLRGGRRRLDLLPVASAVAVFAVWCALSFLWYGEVHLASALARESEPRPLGRLGIQALAVLLGLGGATLLPPLLVIVGSARSFRISRVAGLAAIAWAGVSVPLAFVDWGLPRFEYDPVNRLIGGLMLAAGGTFFIVVLAQGTSSAFGLWQRRAEPDSRRRHARWLLLVVWALGFLLADGLLLFASPKYLVPALAPLTLLLLGGGGEPAVTWPRGSRTLALGATCFLALGLSLNAGAQSAHSRRYVLETVVELADGVETWFTGQWSVRYYAERAGHRYLPGRLTEKTIPEEGDLIFDVLDAVRHPVPEPLRAHLRVVDEASLPAPFPIQHSNPLVKAGYWAHTTGFLPYVWTREPVSVIRTYRFGPGRGQGADR